MRRPRRWLRPPAPRTRKKAPGRSPRSVLRCGRDSSVNRDFYEPDHEAFREVVQAFIKREVTPNEQRWEEERSVDRQAWLAAGKQSRGGMSAPEECGGLGAGDFRYRCVMMEEFARVCATSISSGFGLQDDIAIP